MKKPRTNNNASMNITSAMTPPGTKANKAKMSLSPSSPRKASENACAQIRMKNTMALMRSVLRTVSVSTLRSSRPATAATRMLPSAPMEAASVGAAIPPMIEPSTAKISKTGGRTTLKILTTSSAAVTCARSSAGIAGAMSGRSQAIPSI